MTIQEIKNHKTAVKLLAAAGLIFTTIIWGSSFAVMKNSLDILPPAYLLAIRFSMAAICLVAVFIKKIKKMSKQDLLYGSILGIFLFLAYLFQTYGLKYTTASKNAFITTLYVILVPFLHWKINHTKPKPNNITAAVFAVAGLGLLTLEGDLSVNPGDLLTFLCGVCFAVHIVYIERYTVKHDPIVLTVVQITVCAVLNWCAAPLLEGRLDLKQMNGNLMLSLMYLAVLCTMLGFLLQNVGQKYLAPGITSLLLSFESVFGLIFSVILLGERLTVKLMAGCVLMFAAVLISEVQWKSGKAQTIPEHT